MNVSIVIPCYNEADNINNLFSLWKESIKGKNIEVIFVNNGSQDKSQDIFTELQKKNTDNQIKVLNLKENKGYGGGIQEGLKIANGDGFSDYDNGLEPNYEILEDKYNLGIIGDVNEPLLAETLSRI